jgi:hypothetical protein
MLYRLDFMPGASGQDKKTQKAKTKTDKATARAQSGKKTTTFAGRRLCLGRPQGNTRSRKRATKIILKRSSSPASNQACIQTS